MLQANNETSQNDLVEVLVSEWPSVMKLKYLSKLMENSFIFQTKPDFSVFLALKFPKIHFFLKRMDFVC